MASESSHEAAAAWVARIDRGDWDDLDELELARWLDDNPSNGGALLHAQALWFAMDDAVGGSTAVDLGPRKLISRRMLLAGGASGLAASLALGLFFFSGGASYETEVGEIRRVPLKDGSAATINSMSKIDVRFAKASREVLIERGEAWFQVSKDPARPFIVTTGRVNVEAVGTAFSVRKRDDGAEVIVTEGIVDIWADISAIKRIRLTAGQSAFVSNLALVTSLDNSYETADRALAWREGKIELAGDPLATAVSEINRYNFRKIAIVQPSLNNELFDGIFRIDDPVGFANAVKSSLNVPVDLSDPTEIRIGAHPSPQR